MLALIAFIYAIQKVSKSGINDVVLRLEERASSISFAGAAERLIEAGTAKGNVRSTPALKDPSLYLGHKPGCPNVEMVTFWKDPLKEVSHNWQ